MRKNKETLSKQLIWMLMVYVASVGCMVTISYVLRYIVKYLLMAIQIVI